MTLPRNPGDSRGTRLPIKLQGPLLRKLCLPDGKGLVAVVSPLFLPPPALNVANFHYKGKARRTADIQPNGCARDTAEDLSLVVTCSRKRAGWSDTQMCLLGKEQ